MEDCDAQASAMRSSILDFDARAGRLRTQTDRSTSARLARPRIAYGQSLCCGSGAGGPAMQGTALRYS